MPTAGAFATDRGVCSNQASPADTDLLLETSGCGAFAPASKPPLFRSPDHFGATHRRWIEGREAVAPEAQCGGCRFYILLDGAFIEDWGVCSNPASAQDGRLTFEHAGCDAHVAASTGWGGAVPRASLRRRDGDG